MRKRQGSSQWRAGRRRTEDGVPVVKAVQARYSEDEYRLLEEVAEIEHSSVARIQAIATLEYCTYRLREYNRRLPVPDAKKD